MFENVRERINQGLWQRILAFFILWFAIYGAIWTIFEPMNFAIVTNKRCIWRMFFILFTLFINTCIYFVFLFRKKLEVIGFDAGDTNLLNTLYVNGTAVFNQQNEGFHGRILDVKADYDGNDLNWNINASAHKANHLSITYKAEPNLIFYARVNVLSRNKKSTAKKWLRFEANMSLPQSLEDHEEMGVPVIAKDNNGFLRVNINLPKIIQDAYGAHGWRYDKILIIRAKGSGKIKNIVLK